MIDLTKRQKEVLEIIQQGFAENGMPPTLREIADTLNIRGTLGVMKHLEALERKRYIRRHSGRSRGIELIHQQDLALSPLPLLPIVGRIHAGPLHEAIEDSLGELPTPPELVKDGAFWLQVTGESMIEAAILDGDLVLVHPQQQASNGTIVVAMLNGEATLKRFFNHGDHIELRPENSSLEPIMVEPDNGEFGLIGVMAGLFRNLHATA